MTYGVLDTQNQKFKVISPTNNFLSICLMSYTWRPIMFAEAAGLSTLWYSPKSWDTKEFQKSKQTCPFIQKDK